MRWKMLELHKDEKFTHYFVVYFFLLISSVGIITPIVKPSLRLDVLSSILFPAGPGLLAIIAYRGQKRALRFRLFHTSHSAEQNYDLIVQLCMKRDWSIRHRHHSQFIQATVPGFPWSWGELVTVRFSGTDIYVNSICDPARHPSLVGRNRSNISSVVNMVEGYNQSPGDFDASGLSKFEILSARTFGFIAWAILIGAAIWLLIK